MKIMIPGKPGKLPLKWLFQWKLCFIAVALYKRAQILVADIWACCAGAGYGAFTDIDTVTAFADYRIPQLLVWFDVLQYSDSLMAVLHNSKHSTYSFL